MSSKIITTVIVAAIMVPFTYVATTDAVSIKQNLHKQDEHIQQLSTEYVELDEKLNKTQEVKQKTEAEVQQLEKQTQDAIDERLKLEQELRAS